MIVTRCPHSSGFTSIRLLAVVAGMLSLTACEAPLKLDAVVAQQQQASQRTDFYQSLKFNGSVYAMVGNDGVVLRSANGHDWQRQELDASPGLIDLAVCPDGSFIALSFDNVIWTSKDNAKQWQAVPVDTSEQLMTLDCAPNGSWWAAGSYTTVLHSDDLGKSWSGATLDEDAIITNIGFLNPELALATAEYGMLLRSEDGGMNWDVAGYIPDEFYPHGMFFNDADHGWVSGLNGFIYATQDGGETWEKQATDTAVPLYSFVLHHADLFVLGDNATVLTLKQDRWETVQPPSAPVYLSAGASTDNGLFVAGGHGVMLTVSDTNTAATAE